MDPVEGQTEKPGRGKRGSRKLIKRAAITGDPLGVEPRSDGFLSLAYYSGQVHGPSPLRLFAGQLTG